MSDENSPEMNFTACEDIPSAEFERDMKLENEKRRNPVYMAVQKRLEEMQEDIIVLEDFLENFGEP